MRASRLCLSWMLVINTTQSHSLRFKLKTSLISANVASSTVILAQVEPTSPQLNVNTGLMIGWVWLRRKKARQHNTSTSTQKRSQCPLFRKRGLFRLAPARPISMSILMSTKNSFTLIAQKQPRLTLRCSSAWMNVSMTIREIANHYSSKTHLRMTLSHHSKAN